MKKLTALALALTMIVSLTACGGGTNTGTKAPDASKTTTNATESKPADDTTAGDDNPTGDDKPTGANPDIPEEVIAKRTDKTIEEVVGKTETGKRIVRKVSDTFLELTTASWEYKPVAEYVVVTFGDDGFVSDFCMYYVYGDQTTFWNAFNDSSCAYVEIWCREWSDSKLYYGFYSIPAIIDKNSDEKISWEEAWEDLGTPDEDYIIIE